MIWEMVQYILKKVFRRPSMFAENHPWKHLKALQQVHEYSLHVSQAGDDFQESSCSLPWTPWQCFFAGPLSPSTTHEGRPVLKNGTWALWLIFVFSMRIQSLVDSTLKSRLPKKCWNPSCPVLKVIVTLFIIVRCFAEMVWCLSCWVESKKPCTDGNCQHSTSTRSGCIPNKSSIHGAIFSHTFFI